MGKRNSMAQSIMFDAWTYQQYRDRLTEMAISRFKWTNLPESIDERFLEITLFEKGQAVFFYDSDLGHLTLPVAISGGFNVYRLPINRRAYAVNGYQAELTINDSVMIYNNFLRKNSILDVRMFSHRLAELDRTIDVNSAAQKTPILITCDDESQKLTLENVYAQISGNKPAICTYSKSFNPNSIKVFQTGAPYVCDKLFMLKTQIWNEALTYLGIPNVSIEKRERLISDEVDRHQGGTIASRNSYLEARRQACDQINKMFGLNISVDFRTDNASIVEGDDSDESLHN